MTVSEQNPFVAKDRLHQLMARNDRSAAIHLASSVFVFLGAGILAIELGVAESRWWIAAAIICGGALTTFFPAMHECGHRSAFRGARVNDIATSICAFLMLQAPSFFREFHWQHHRKTQDRQEDPEISASPAILDGWPRNPLVYLGLASGQHLLVGKPIFTLSAALMPNGRAWLLLYPFIRPEKRRRIAWESRLVLVLWVSLVVLGLRTIDGFSYFLAAWPIAHLFLGLYLMAEHTGLPNHGSQLQRTRTIISNRIVRWLMWNMPLHAAHHAYPAIPFHQVPALHAEMQPMLCHVSQGYLAFHVEALLRAIRLR